MPVERISIETYLAKHRACLTLDVRSPGEYAHAHIPGARSLPLFSDAERAEIGTAYKRQSQPVAIKIGLRHFGPKLVPMVEQVEQWQRESGWRSGLPAEAPPLVVHCWRGGMRSAGVAWLLDLYGFRVMTIAGGYKAYRGWALQQMERPYPFAVIGGPTGSGKTEVLQELSRMGHAVLDLEGLASHKGSAFGNIGMPPQPSQEMFENLLAWRLHELMQDAQVAPGEKPVWVEDESRRIGDVNLSPVLYRHLRSSPLYLMDVPFEERLRHILKGYGKGEIERFVNAIIRIRKRLGGLEAKTAINHLLEGDMAEGFRVLLQYYDKWYAKGMTDGRESIVASAPVVFAAGVDAAMQASALLDAWQQRRKVPENKPADTRVPAGNL